MAIVSITRSWGNDGDALEIIVDVENSFPDAVAEAKANALAAFRDALGVTIAAEVGEE